MNIISEQIVTIFKIGKFPYAPGTIGSLFAFLTLSIFYQNINYNIFFILFIILLVISNFLVGIYIKDLINKDAKEIIIDEFIGCYLIYLFFPIFKNENQFLLIILSFFIFRFFDIIKLYPANIIDKKMKNSFGIILDDIIASIYSIIVLLFMYKYVL